MTYVTMKEDQGIAPLLDTVGSALWNVYYYILSKISNIVTFYSKDNYRGGNRHRHLPHPSLFSPNPLFPTS